MTDLVESIDRALGVAMNDQPATTEDLKEIFGDGYNEEYQDEAERRWGDTDKWKQSQERTAHWPAPRDAQRWRRPRRAATAPCRARA